MERGDLVPDKVVTALVQERLQADDCQAQGWLLDGFPRTKAQADELDQCGIRPDVFVLLQVSDDALVQRVTGRRLDPATGKIYHLKYKPPPKEIESRLKQRVDDTEAKVRVRIAAYKRNIDAIRGNYAHVVREVDGERTPEEVSTDVVRILSSL